MFLIVTIMTTSLDLPWEKRKIAGNDIFPGGGW